MTKGLAAVVARAGFVPLRDRGRALTDATAALAAGATCLSDIEAMTAQVEIFGSTGGASDSTVLRVLNELAARLNADGLPGRRLARVTAAARATAWKWIVDRHGQLPAVKVAGIDLTRPRVDSGGVDGDGGGVDGGPDRPVLVVRLGATLIGADSDKDGAAGNYKAHQMEDAATSALSTELDYRSVVNLQADLDAWARQARAGTSRSAVRAAVANLGMLLEDEQFPRAAAQTFDARRLAGSGRLENSHSGLGRCCMGVRSSWPEPNPSESRPLHQADLLSTDDLNSPLTATLTDGTRQP